MKFLQIVLAIYASLGAAAIQTPYLGPVTDTSVYIRWQNTDTMSVFKVAYGLTTAYGDTVKPDSSVRIYLDQFYGEGFLHPLTANTAYHYKVITSDGNSSDYTFRTLPAKTEYKKLKIGVIGDMHLNTTTDTARVRAMISNMVNVDSVDVVLQCGDQAKSNGETTPAEWNAYLSQVNTGAASVWLAPSLGNHTAGNNVEITNYFKMFRTSGAGINDATEVGHRGAYYSFDAGIVHIICLDSEIEGLVNGNDITPSTAEQMSWYISDVRAARAAGARWIVVFSHQSPFSSGGSGNHASDYGALIFQAGIGRKALEDSVITDMHFAGHSHCYLRFSPLKDTAINAAGTHYYINGIGHSDIRQLTLGTLDSVGTSLFYYYNIDSSRFKYGWIPPACGNSGADTTYQAAYGDNYRNGVYYGGYNLVEIDSNHCKTTQKMVDGSLNIVNFDSYSFDNPNIDWESATPTVPVTVVSYPTACCRATVRFTSSTDDGSISGYAIKRNGIVVDTVTDTVFLDSGLAPSSQYYYAVAAIDNLGNESAFTSNTATFSTWPIPAFPGAEGFGAVAKGGRGGTVLHVTNLNDDGAGSFRAAVGATGARYVVFDTGGICTLTTGPVVIHDSLITILGQTAPGGFTLFSSGAGGLHTVWMAGDDPPDSVSNIIVRYLRVRGANDGDQGDALRLYNVRNAIFDHCSFSWNTDECADLSRSIGITLQWCVFADGITGVDDHNLGVFHCYGRSSRFSMHHNIVSGFNYRLPVYNSDSVDVRNNVLYNWRDGGTDLDNISPWEHVVPAPHEINIVGNYYKKGPESRTDHDDNEPIMISDSMIYYIAGNYYSSTDAFTTTTAAQMTQNDVATWNANSWYFDGTGHVKTHSYSDAYSKTTDSAGCFPRDTVDRKARTEITAGTGVWYNSTPSSQHLPTGLTFAHAPADADADGMPDAWETANGLNPSSNDANGTGLSYAYTHYTGYTNLEVYAAVLSDSLLYGLPTVRISQGAYSDSTGLVKWATANVGGNLVARFKSRYANKTVRCVISHEGSPEDSIDVAPNDSGTIIISSPETGEYPVNIRTIK